MNVFRDIIDLINKRTGKQYSTHDQGHFQAIRFRMDMGTDEKTMIRVIEKKCDDWVGTDKEKYLTPSFLLGKKFDEFVNELLDVSDDPVFKILERYSHLYSKNIPAKVLKAYTAQIKDRGVTKEQLTDALEECSRNCGEWPSLADLYRIMGRQAESNKKVEIDAEWEAEEKSFTNLLERLKNKISVEEIDNLHQKYLEGVYGDTFLGNAGKHGIGIGVFLKSFVFDFYQAKGNLNRAIEIGKNKLGGNSGV